MEQLRNRPYVYGSERGIGQAPHSSRTARAMAAILAAGSSPNAVRRCTGTRIVARKAKVRFWRVPHVALAERLFTGVVDYRFVRHLGLYPREAANGPRSRRASFAGAAFLPPATVNVRPYSCDSAA